MNDDIKAGADHMAGDGGYTESTKEKHRAATAARIKVIQDNIKAMVDAQDEIDEKLRNRSTYFGNDV